MEEKMIYQSKIRENEYIKITGNGGIGGDDYKEELIKESLVDFVIQLDSDTLRVIDRILLQRHKKGIRLDKYDPLKLIHLYAVINDGDTLIEIFNYEVDLINLTILVKDFDLSNYKYFPRFSVEID